MPDNFANFNGKQNIVQIGNMCYEDNSFERGIAFETSGFIYGSAPQEIDEYELVDRVDILTPLEKTGFWDGVKAAKWSERKEAIAELTKLASTKRIAPCDFTEIYRTLKKVYQLLGDIKLEFDDSHAPYIEETYSRVLDLDTATTKVKYSAGEVEFVKEHFASNPDQVIVTKISGSKLGSLSFMVSLDSKLHHHSSVNGKNQIIMEGSCPGKTISPKLNENDNPKGIQFSAILDLQISDVGTINVLDGNKLKNEGSDWAVMLLLSKSSKNVGENGCLDRKKHLSSATDLFLENSEDKMVSTAERVKSFQTDEDPSLVELLSQYGRYLLISCSRPGTQVANLQGIWNKDIEPAWDGAQHLNINLQMNYWPSLPCNLHECQEPLFDYILSLSVNGSKTAKQMVGLHIRCQIYRQKHLLTEVRLFRLYGKWVEHGFVLIYGNIILILAGLLLLQCCCEAAATRRCSISSVFFACTSTLVDIITKTQSVTGNNTIVSSGGSFEMGFFSPGNSRNTYLGIWYKKISVQTVVWVANREIPLVNSSGVLTIIDPGILALVDGTGSVIWSPNVTGPVAQLMESGNLVVKDANNNILWQSFDYPCDTLLPGMKHGKNFVTGIDRMLSSWKSSDDPARGKYTYRCDPQGYPQIITSCGSVEVFRTGPWNGLGFSYLNLKLNSIYTYELVYTKEEVYFHYQLVSSVVSRLTLNQNGVAQRWIWVDRTQEWVIYRSAPTDACDTYKLCGPNGNCNIGNSPVCDCLSKFVPQNQTEWISGDWSNGCVRRTMLDCHNGDGFLKYSHYKMPDTRYSWFDKSMTLRECEMRCLKNCSCMAYTSLDISGGGSGCLLWFDELIDMRQYSDKGQDIYIRMASSELVQRVGFNGKKIEIVAVSLALLIGLLLLGVSLTCYLRKKKRKNSQLNREGNLMQNSKQGYTDKSQNDDLELPLFDLTVIANSTNNFSINNKLGEGGFGPVYKGMLEGGQEIAVKRLSKNSSQGLDEFKNEVICIAKLQHRNLVKLLGCCIQGEEKMLIYEYMPNKSLDYFIFDQTQSGLLDWPKRFHIINGIARGLLYLHQDSRLRIIHRDLKASNILLDVDMNPKISDFGMARSFRGNETEANTNKVVGTYGYMSPEYAVDGLFSIKSDVFSFGVLVLEIVSGKKNKGFYHPDHHLNLLGHAWRLYKENRSFELIDEALWDSCYLTEAKQPGFFTERNVLEVAGSSRKEATTSANEMTIIC
ncbi:hypothetical protein TEA_021803 [Camellia sinensis var. sinensis]|uniref:non-specific serine/threonine protein kinase n=1 Tax=Camellia sinensis var. sinensis TaxID=542762 RepID=A0A4S4DLC3_CAMSN|nr:hypothetical protein TEA_021803 [Camellia sinensis var. sinensis]